MTTKKNHHQGENNPNAKLTRDIIRRIRAAAKDPDQRRGWQSKLWRELAAEGITIGRGTLGDIIHGRRWQEVHSDT